MRKGFYIVILVFLSIITIFFQFNKIPVNIDRDEIAFVRLARSLNNKSYRIYTPQETGHSTLYFYLLLTSFKLFGLNLWALRIPAAIFGVLNGLFIYLIFDLVFREKIKFKFRMLIFLMPVGFILALIFITLRWQFNFARFAYEATFLLFLELGSIYCLIRALKKQNILFVLICGIFAGLAFNSYTPGRIFFLLPLIILFIDKKTRILIFYYALACLPFIIPLVIALIHNPEPRVVDELILLDRNLDFIGKSVILLQNITKNIFMIFVIGDMNGRHNYPGKPALNPILSLFLIAGYLFSLKEKKNIYWKMFSIYFLLSLIPTLFTLPKGNPNMLRTYTLIPSIIYFIWIALNKISSSMSFWQVELKTRRVQNLIVICFFLLLSVSSFYELRTYFKFQKEVTKYSFEVRKSFEWLKERNFELVDTWYKY